MTDMVILRHATMIWDSVLSIASDQGLHVEVAATPGEAFAACIATRPSLLITPDRWDERPLLDVLLRLRTSAPQTRCVVLADSIEPVARDTYTTMRLAAYVLLPGRTNQSRALRTPASHAANASQGWGYTAPRTTHDARRMTHGANVRMSSG